MTILMTLIGIPVFFVSSATSGFRTGFHRLIGFALTGFLIDVIIIGSATMVAYVNYI